MKSIDYLDKVVNLLKNIIFLDAHLHQASKKILKNYRMNAGNHDLTVIKILEDNGAFEVP